MKRFVMLLTSLLLVCFASCKFEPKVVLTGLRVDDSSVKKSYYVGDNLDLSNLKVYAQYSDGSEKEINNYVTSKTDGMLLETAETLDVDVIYESFTAKFSISIADVYLERIELDTENVKKTFYQSEPFTYDRLTVTGYYNNGDSKTLYDYSVSFTQGASFSDYGPIEVTVSYGDLKAFYEINVIPVEIVSLKLNTENVKKDFYQSERFTSQGLKVYEWYNDGSYNEIDIYDVSVSENAEFEESGTKEIVVSVGDVKATYSINVIKVVPTAISLNTENVKVNYKHGDSLDLSGLVVTGFYNDGSRKVVTEYDASITNGTTLKKVGVNSVVISYEYCTSSFDINVDYDSTVESVNITIKSYNDVQNLLTKSENTFIAAEGYKDYIWMLDDTIVQENSNSYTPDVSILIGKNYNLMVIVKDAQNNVYSATVNFIVNK